MIRFPKSKGKIQAIQILITQYTCVEGEGIEGWIENNNQDVFGDPLIADKNAFLFAFDYLEERMQRVSE